MHRHPIRHPGSFALALLLIAPQAAAIDAAPLPAATLPTRWRRRLRRRRSRNIAASSKEYQEARAAFEAEAGAYWNSIAEKRRGRNAKRREHLAIGLDDYVLTQPPVYTGPKRPGNPEPRARAARPPRAQIYSRGRRSPEGRGGAFPVRAAAARERGRVQARLCPRRIGGRADARAGGAGLCVRDRRQRQSRHAVGTGILAAGARDLDRDRLQPAAHHQQRRTARRAGPRIRPRACREGGAIVRRRAPGDGAQDRGAEADGGAGALGAGRMGAAREARRYAAGLGACMPWCWTSMSARCCRPTSS